MTAKVIPFAKTAKKQETTEDRIATINARLEKINRLLAELRSFSEITNAEEPSP